MNTEKSAIEKMVEWLENRLAKPENVVAGVLLELVKTKARRLAAEEKAKPVEATAEASLVEGICGSCNGSGMVQIAPNVRGMTTCRTCKGKGKMTGYRPAPTAVEELVRELRGMLKEYHPDSEEYCSETKHLAYDIETILAKYDNEKGGK